MIMTIMRITPVTSPPRNVPVKDKNCWYEYALPIKNMFLNISPDVQIPTKVIGFGGIDALCNCTSLHVVKSPL